MIYNKNATNVVIAKGAPLSCTALPYAKTIWRGPALGGLGTYRFYATRVKNSFFFEPVSPCQVNIGASSAQRAPRDCFPARHRTPHGRQTCPRWPRRRARATPAHPASGRGVGKDASFEEHHLAKPCCARTCIRLLAAELSLLKNLSSRSAIAIANAYGPNPTIQAAGLPSI